jgi:hypothetical protein
MVYSTANRCVFLGIPCKRCQHPVGCAFMVDIRGPALLGWSPTLRLFYLLNKFGNSVVCNVFAMFPVKFHSNLATYV